MLKNLIAATALSLPGFVLSDSPGDNLLNKPDPIIYSTPNPSSMTEQVQQIFDRDTAVLFPLYRHIHKNPELGFACHRTAASIKKALKKLGLREGRDYRMVDNLAESGFAIIFENGDGPVILYRADMDALILEEETGLEYQSTNGLHHGCGHDVHSVLAAGVASAMQKLRSQWHGTLIVLWQPAEEAAGGAERMIKEGLYNKIPKPDYVVFTHVFDKLPAGTVGLRTGDTMAGAAFWNVTVPGIPGHGGRGGAVNPIKVANEFMTEFFDLPKFMPAGDTVLVNIAGVETGHTYNVTPKFVHLKCSARLYDRNNVALIESKMAEIAHRLEEKNYPENSGCKIEMPRGLFCEKLYSDPVLYEAVKAGILQALPAENVRHIEPITSSEDITALVTNIDGKNIPILLVRLGVQNAQKFAAGEKLAGVHTGGFAPDYQPALETGVQAITNGLVYAFNHIVY